MNLKCRLPLITVIITSVLCMFISIFSLKSGQFIVFQNVFYIPIIVACFYYGKRGFVFSIVLSGIYFFLIIAFTSDTMIIRGALVRVTLFIFIAAVITALSTARARAEEELKKEREKFRTVADYAYDWEYWTDPQQNMRYVSPSCERISGYRPVDFMTESGLIHRVVHPEDRDIFKYHADQYHELQIDSVGEVDFRIVNRKGEERWIAHICRPVYSTDGQFLGRRASNRDIAERKRAEEALRESEGRYKNFVEKSFAGVYVVQNGLFVFLNDNAASFAGYKPEELIGKQSDSIVYPEDQEIIRDKARKMLRGEDASPHEFRIVTKDGQIRWIMETLMSIRYDGREAILGNSMDITERKGAEEALQASQELEKSILLSVPHALFGVEQRRIFFANAAMEEVFGWKSEEFIGQSTRMIFRNDAEWEEYGAMLYSQLKTKSVFVFESDVPFVRKDGREIFCRMSVSRTGEDLGKHRRIVATFEDVTERRHIEKEIREAGERYKSLIAVSNTGAWEYHFDTDYLWCSPEYFSMLGLYHNNFDLSGAANLKEVWIDLLHPEDQERARQHFRDYLRNGSHELYESNFRMKHADGSWAWIWSRGRTLRNEKGEFTNKTVGTHIEITKRKQDEEALRYSENRFRSVFQTSPIGLCIIKDRIYQSANRAWYDDFGYTEEEIIGHTTRMLYDSDEEYERVGQELYSNFLERCIASVQTKLRRKDGVFRDAIVTSAPLHQDDFSAGTVVAVEDITDRMSSEEELRENRRQLADIIEFLPDATLAIDKERHVIIWNKAIEDMTGVPAAEIIGKGDYAYTIPFYGEARPQLMDLVFEDRDEIARRYPQITREGDTLIAEAFCNALYDNKGAWVIAKASPLHDHSGNIIGAIESIRDITPRKQAENAIARLNSQLQAKNKELEQVVYVASHDLRSPLVNIDGYSKEVEYAVQEFKLVLDAEHVSNEALRAAVRSPMQEMSSALNYIRRSATQMDALLTGLLKLSRSGRSALTIGPLNMNELISGVVAAIDFQIKEAGVELHIAELPPCRGDAIQVRQVFTNLLSNALKYLDPERTGVIRISGVLDGERSLYSVEDNGIGIAQAHQENIFEVFHRLEPSKSEGEGLGLTIVQQILGRLGGEVRVESKPGEGSRFSVALPVASGGE